MKIGTVVSIDARTSQYGGIYPVVVLRTDDGEETAIHGYHTVLKGEIANLQPKVGDRLGIKYFGLDPRGYEKYRVAIDGPVQSAAVDWKAMADDARTEAADEDDQAVSH